MTSAKVLYNYRNIAYLRYIHNLKSVSKRKTQAMCGRRYIRSYALVPFASSIHSSSFNWHSCNKLVTHEFESKFRHHHVRCYRPPLAHLSIVWRIIPHSLACVQHLSPCAILFLQANIRTQGCLENDCLPASAKPYHLFFRSFR